MNIYNKIDPKKLNHQPRLPFLQRPTQRILIGDLENIIEDKKEKSGLTTKAGEKRKEIHPYQSYLFVKYLRLF